jgi:hypothetical protein
VPLAAGQPPRPAALTLGANGARLTLDGRPEFLLFVSYFDGLRSPHIERDFEYLGSQTRVRGVRVLPNWLRCDEDIHDPHCSPARDGLFDAAAGSVRADRLEALQHLIAVAGAQGLVVDVTFTRETLAPEMPVDAYERAIVRTAAALKPFRNVLFDIQNEFDKNGLSPDEVGTIREGIRRVDPARLVAASGSGGYTPQEAARLAFDHGLDLLALHDPRREGSWFRRNTIADLVAKARDVPGRALPLYFQEPTAWGTRSDDDEVVAHFLEAAGSAERAGAAAWTFHQRVGFNLERESFRTRLGRDAPMKHLLESLGR